MIKLAYMNKACILIALLFVCLFGSNNIYHKTYNSYSVEQFNIDNNTRLGISDIFVNYPDKYNYGLVGQEVVLEVSVKEGFDENKLEWFRNPKEYGFDDAPQSTFWELTDVKGSTFHVPTDEIGENYYMCAYEDGWILEGIISDYSRGEIVKVEILEEAPQELWTISLDHNGGDGGANEVLARYGDPLQSGVPSPRNNKRFLGYYDKISSDGKQYYDKDMKSVRNYDKIGNSKLYAMWDDSHTITYLTLDANGGDGGVSNIIADYGLPMPQVQAPIRYEYKFMGYQDEDGTLYYDQDMNSMSNWDKLAQEGDTYPQDTLYAQWEKEVEKYTVKLDFNGGSGGTSRVDVIYGEDMPQATAPTREGYNFKGYTSSVSGVKFYYDENMNSMVAWDNKQDSTLYAQWEESEVIIPPTTDPQSPQEPPSLDYGAISGWILGGVLVVGVITSIVLILIKKRSSKSVQNDYYGSQNTFVNTNDYSQYRNNLHNHNANQYLKGKNNRDGNSYYNDRYGKY
ncbi:MAG: InlB B-repeat-containing protein [Firmicutes bacterium]|nr:InlB B-repeat-containing protein [Bacillota bacterium]MCL1953520.1 InlB B-repeat-containing protein [Bacillota bacterium]